VNLYSAERVFAMRELLSVANEISASKTHW